MNTAKYARTITELVGMGFLLWLWWPPLQRVGYLGSHPGMFDMEMLAALVVANTMMLLAVSFLMFYQVGVRAAGAAAESLADRLHRYRDRGDEA